MSTAKRTTFAICLLTALSVLRVSAGTKPKKVHVKKIHVSVRGVITSKTEIVDRQIVELKDRDDKAFSCFLSEPDSRFRDFHAGDQVVVSGSKEEGSNLISRCMIVLWRSK